MKSIIINLSFLFLGTILCAQDSLNISFQALLNDTPIVLEQEQLKFEGESIEFETLKFYVSQIVLSKKGKNVWSEADSYHLVDASDENSLTINLSYPEDLEFDSIQFLLGIDSLTNVSGAMGGDLDPTKGMYWAWNSGYINFKLEGYSNLCTSRDHAFIYHLGGYAAPYQTVQQIQLSANNKEHLEIGLDIGLFLQAIGISKEHSIMSPGEQVRDLSVVAASIFFVKE